MRRMLASDQMALGEFTKQIAQQALLSATAPKETPSAPPPNCEDTGLVMMAQIQAMQKALKDDEELVVHAHAASDRIRVMEIFLPSPAVVVLRGVDTERATVRVVSPVEALQLVVRVAKVPPGAKAARVAFVTPKPRDSSAK